MYTIDESKEFYFITNDVAEFNLLQENVKNNLVNTELIVNNQNVNIMLTKS